MVLGDFRTVSFAYGFLGLLFIEPQEGEDQEHDKGRYLWCSTQTCRI